MTAVPRHALDATLASRVLPADFRVPGDRAEAQVIFPKQEENAKQRS